MKLYPPPLFTHNTHNTHTHTTHTHTQHTQHTHTQHNTHTHTVGPNVTLTSSSLDNNRVRLTCSAQGYPRLDRVAWQTGDGNAVSGSVDEINSMESSTFDFSLTSTLDLERSRCDGIVYRCSVSSGSITRSTSITCRIGMCMTV